VHHNKQNAKYELPIYKKARPAAPAITAIPKPVAFAAPPVNSDKEGVLKVALGKLVVGIITDAEAVDMITISVVVEDSVGVSTGIAEDVVKNSVSVSVSVSVSTGVSMGVSAGTADDAVVVGSAKAVVRRTRVETP
jgi:hypothetical protein